MNNISLRTRLHSLFIIMMILLLGLGYFSLEKMDEFSLKQMKKVESVNTISSDALLATVLFKKQVQEWKNMLIRGHKPKDFEKYSNQFESTRLAVIDKVNKIINESNQQPKLKKVAEEFLAEHEKLTVQYYNAIPLLLKRKDGLGYRDVDIQVRGIDRAPTKLIESVKKMAEKINIVTAFNVQQETIAYKQDTLINASILFALLTLLYIALVETSLIRPIKYLSRVVKNISDGDFAVRANIKTGDEIGVLAQSFDALLDNRLAESTQLSASILKLLTSVSQLSQKDLRIKVPVAEDVTGAVSDAINHLSSETAKTLAQVNQISIRVNDSSTQIQEKSKAVIELAKRERTETEQIVLELNGAVESMNQIAKFIDLTNQSAAVAIKKPYNALEADPYTVLSINKIRDTLG